MLCFKTDYYEVFTYWTIITKFNSNELTVLLSLIEYCCHNNWTVSINLESDYNCLSFECVGGYCWTHWMSYVAGFNTMRPTCIQHIELWELFRQYVWIEFSKLGCWTSFESFLCISIIEIYCSRLYSSRCVGEYLKQKC